MDRFEDKLAVVTGGGTGIGRALVCQLIKAGAHVAMCDVYAEQMAETAELATPFGPGRLSSHICDVSSEVQMNRFRDAVLKEHNSDHINLLINNAGIAGGGSFIEDPREEWERTFSVCWYGVYFGCRAFIPALLESDEGHIVNTSSVNGFWASLGQGVPHTSYSAAKFAVKGFTEALVTELRLLAPHVQCSVVMPGHVGTSILLNSFRAHGQSEPKELSAHEIAGIREDFAKRGLPVDNIPDDHIREMLQQQAETFRDEAPTTSDEAAEIILDGVRENRWRILVGRDAVDLDRIVREAPEEAYETSLAEKMMALGHFQAVPSVVESQDP